MIKSFIYLAGILILFMTAAFAANAQEINATQNNTTLNSTIMNNTTIAATPAEEAMNLGEASRDSQNLSTINGKQTTVADISGMAGAAPLLPQALPPPSPPAISRAHLRSGPVLVARTHLIPSMFSWRA